MWLLVAHPYFLISEGHFSEQRYATQTSSRGHPFSCQGNLPLINERRKRYLTGTCTINNYRRRNVNEDARFANYVNYTPLPPSSPVVRGYLHSYSCQSSSSTTIRKSSPFSPRSWWFYEITEMCVCPYYDEKGINVIYTEIITVFSTFVVILRNHRNVRMSVLRWKGHKCHRWQ